MKGVVINVDERVAGSELLTAVTRVANMIVNPSFTSALTGWSAVGTGPPTITRDTAVFVPGFVASCRLDQANPGASSDRVEAVFALTSGEEYIFRGLARSPLGKQNRFWVVDNLSVKLGEDLKTGDGGFQYFEVRFTATANNNHRVRMGRNAAGDPGGSYYLGFAQLIRVLDGAILPLTPYASGEFGGPYAWSGTAGNSTTLAKGMLEVDDPTDFEEAGWVLVGDDDLHPDVELLEYSVIDEDTGVITGLTSLAQTYAVGERVEVYPTAKARVAWVLVDEGDEALPAVVPHFLYDRIPVGVRDDRGEIVELGWNDSVLIVSDVIGQEPANDPSFLSFDSSEQSWSAFAEFMEPNTNMVSGDFCAPGFICNFSGTGAGITQGTDVGRPGIAVLDTGTTTTGRSQVRSAPSSLDWASGQMRFGAMVKGTSGPGPTNNYIQVVGFANALSGLSQPATNNIDCAMFKVEDGDTNWKAQCCDGVSAGSSDTGVVYTSNVWYLLEVVVNIPEGWVRFYINGVLVATRTTLLPNSTNCQYLVAIEKISGTAARQLYCDYAYGDGVAVRPESGIVGATKTVSISDGQGGSVYTRNIRPR